MGIVVLFVAVFPNVGAGGKHLFKAEVPGTTAEGLKPRIGETSLTLWMIYAGITLVEAILLGFAGMDPFEAICHALTTMSTGGFSTRDGSVGAFGLPAVEYIIGFFMLVGSVNFGLYYAALRRGSLTVVAKNLEFRFFVLFVALSTATLAVVNYPLHADMETSFRKAFFMVGTSVSSTGYGADEYTVWPAPSLTIMLCLMFMGGSAGSTAGGMKVERVVLLAKQGVAQVKKYYRPSAVQLVRMGRKVVSSEVLGDVAAFFMLYMWTIALGVFVVSLLEGIPVDAAFGASLTCVANSGPAPFHVGDDNFAAFGATTKIFFAVLMLLGRLEFFTLLSLLVPSFWRR